MKQDITSGVGVVQTPMPSELRRLGFELEGVLAEVDHKGLQAFDKVCEQTVERVRLRLAELAAGGMASLMDDPARPTMSMFATAADYNAAMDEWLRARGVMGKENGNG